MCYGTKDFKKWRFHAVRIIADVVLHILYGFEKQQNKTYCITSKGARHQQTFGKTAEKQKKGGCIAFLTTRKYNKSFKKQTFILNFSVAVK